MKNQNKQVSARKVVVTYTDGNQYTIKRVKSIDTLCGFLIISNVLSSGKLKAKSIKMAQVSFIKVRNPDDVSYDVDVRCGKIFKLTKLLAHSDLSDDVRLY